MKKLITHAALAVVFVSGIYLQAPRAEAALITDAQVTEQRAVVQNADHTAVQERLKLLQMLLIQALEQRIDQLKTQLGK
jgi:hypothetical protein